MSKVVFCQYLKKNAKALDFQFYPGEIGKKIFENISEEAWQIWLGKQTMLINENRLNLTKSEDKAFLEKQMIDFLFEGKNIEIAGYSPEIN